MEKWARLKYQPGIALYEDGQRVTGSKGHIEIARKAADESIVLLKNDGALPLSKNTKLALFGKASFEYVKGGGGSGDVYCKYIHSLYDGLKIRKVEVFEPLIDLYKDELKKQYDEGIVPGMTEEVAVPEALFDKAGEFTDTALIVINRFSGESWDRSNISCDNEFNPWPQGLSMTEVSGRVFPEGDFYITEKEKAMIESVSKRFKKVIAVLNIGGVIDCRWIAGDDSINAAIYMGQGGMEGGLSCADVLLGNVCPSGRLTDTFAGELSDYPSTEGFHDSFDYVDYNEDIYVGYRYFETVEGAASKVVYPFGYGLSYASFETEVVSYGPLSDGFTFTVKVTNTGSVSGKEVVQLYFGSPQGLLGKPKKVLADFEKTKELEPGESVLLPLSVTFYQMSSFDDLGKVREASYVLEKGVYEFFIGSDVRSAKKVDFSYGIENDVVVKELTHKLAPVSLKKRMLSDGSYEELPTGPDKDINECIFEKMEPGTEEALTPVVRAVESHYLTHPYKEGAVTFVDVADGKATLDEFVSGLPIERLIDILGGQPNTGVGNVFGFGNLPEYGVPNAQTADGPAGVRISPQTGVLTTAFPCATSIACTWNKDLAEEIGFAGGEEVKENNLCVWLTPAINIHRNPMCGRNFEYYSEDPYLTGRMAAAMVRGIQKNRIGASVKHFACNNKETNRKHCDSRVSERALREIYLKAFEIIVRESDPYTIMSSYNAVNGERTSESHDLLTGILRDEWGFNGFVTSDWWNRAEQYKEINAGNDLKMGCGFTDRVLKAMEMGAIDRKTIETSAKRILNVILKFD